MHNNLFSLNKIKDICWISLLGTAFSFFPSTNVRSLAYTVNDSLNCGQSISFSWTEKGAVSNQPFIFSWNTATTTFPDLELSGSPLTYTLNCDEGLTQVTDIIPDDIPFLPADGNPDISILSDTPVTFGPSRIVEGILLLKDIEQIDFSFEAPSNATDWKQVITGENGGSVVEAAGLIPLNTEDNIQNSSVDNNLFQFIPLNDLPNLTWRIPDLAPFSGNNPNLTIYTAVNLSLYLENNPLGFNNGNWQVGQTLNDIGIEIVEGSVAGLEGIYWSTTPFTLDLTSETGFTPIGGEVNLLNSNNFREDIGVLQQHNATVPENSSSISFLIVTLLSFLTLVRFRHGLNAKYS